MKPGRFKRTKSVAASSAIALVVAALVIGLSSLVLGPRSTSPQRPGFDLTSDPSSFTITSAVYTSPACSGTPALLYPGTTRCAVFTVHNLLSVPISVQSISSALDTSFPAPPSNCAPPTYFTLPTFTGPATVLAGATTALPGVPIKLLESGNSQDACRNFVYHFTYSGTAQYTDSTSTTLTSAPNPSTSGQSVTFTATVTAGNPSTDSSLPSGTVTFYECTSATVCPNGAGNVLGTGTIGAGGKTTHSTSALPIGTTYVDAVYPASGTDFLTSTSGVVAQVVGSSLVGTTTALTSAPDPSAHGQAVMLTATVTKTSGSGTPTGTVTFHLGSPTGTVVGTGTVNSSGKATATTSTLPTGTGNLYAVYSGDPHFSGSTSPVRVQTVIGLPTQCTGSYPNFFYGDPHFLLINGTNQGDFVYALGANYLINGFNGNDCLVAGDGNNLITDRNGNDVVTAGNGNNLITVGNGGDSVTAGNGTNQIIAGNGTDTVSVGNGSHNQIIAGNGTDTITIGTGTFNTVTLGSGPDTVTLTSPTPLTPTHDTINGGANTETIYLGAGSYNTVYGGRGHNTCHLPKPPSSWHGAVADYYHDTITNCTVVTP